MKAFKSYMMALGLLSLLGLGACQNDFDDPTLKAPESEWKANTTIEELKTKYWDDATNYIKEVGLTDDGQHVIISGRVISSDASGNIYKSLVIQDATGALAMSINANSLYTSYRVGQEILVDVTGMYIGKYNGLQQLGMPEWYAAGQAWEATFMPKEFFLEHIQLNGWPEPDKVETLVLNGDEIASSSAANLIKYQSQLVRFDNCRFEDGGKLDFTDGSQVTSNRNLILSNGSTIVVRTSGYSNFWDDLLPEGVGSVVGILSYYGTSGWQLLIRSREDLIGFAKTEGNGSFDKPFDVPTVINMESTGQGGSGWVQGYIVGAVAPGVSAVASNDDVEFTATPSMDNTLVIAPTPDVTDYTKCLVVSLPAGSDFRKYGNLVDNPTNYKRAIKVQGTFARVLSTWGITGNTGAKTEFTIDGVTVPDAPEYPDEVVGEGTQDNPYTCNDVILLKNPGTTSWVSGYIVGYVNGNTITAAAFTVPADRVSNILIADNPGETDPERCIPVELKSGTDLRRNLNLMDNPELLGAPLKVEGTLTKYMNTTGIKAPVKYAL